MQQDSWDLSARPCLSLANMARWISLREVTNLKIKNQPSICTHLGSHCFDLRKKASWTFHRKTDTHSRNLPRASLLHERPLARRPESHQLAVATSTLSSFLPGQWNSMLKIREMSTKMDMLQLLHMSKSVDDACCLPPMYDGLFSHQKPYFLPSKLQNVSHDPKQSWRWSLISETAPTPIFQYGPTLMGVRRLVTFSEECTSKSESKS